MRAARRHSRRPRGGRSARLLGWCGLARGLRDFSRWWSAPAAPAVGVRGSIPRVGPRGIACLTETPVLRGFSLALMPSPPASRLPPPLPLTRTEGLAYCCMDKSVSSVTYGRSSPPGILPHLQIRGACWPARSVGTHLHAAWRWNVSRPGDPTYAVSSAFRHNPRRWRPALHQGDHTQLDRFGQKCDAAACFCSPVASQCPRRPRRALFSRRAERRMA